MQKYIFFKNLFQKIFLYQKKCIFAALSPEVPEQSNLGVLFYRKQPRIRLLQTRHVIQHRIRKQQKRHGQTVVVVGVENGFHPSGNTLANYT